MNCFALVFVEACYGLIRTSSLSQPATGSGLSFKRSPYRSLVVTFIGTLLEHPLEEPYRQPLEELYITPIGTLKQLVALTRTLKHRISTLRAFSS